MNELMEFLVMLWGLEMTVIFVVMTILFRIEQSHNDIATNTDMSGFSHAQLC